MAFGDVTTGGRVLQDGFFPVDIVLTDTCEPGDLIGFDGTDYKRADGNAGILAMYVAGHRVNTSGDTLTAYKAAVVAGFTAGTKGAALYLSDTVGEYSASAGTNRQAVGHLSTTTEGFIFPNAGPGGAVFRDNDELVFGDGGDVYMRWDATDFDVLAAANNSVFKFGNGTNSFDLWVYGSAAANYIEWDASANLLALRGAGTFLVGHTAVLQAALLETVGATSVNMTHSRFSATAGTGVQWDTYRSKSGTKGTNTGVVSADTLLDVNVYGADGTNYGLAAGIDVIAGTTFSATTTAARMELSTTGEGATTPTVRAVLGRVVGVSAAGGVLQLPAQTLATNNASSTLAVGAGVSLGVPTFTNNAATLTYTDAATLYIAGIPVASTNTAITNTALALWVDAGISRFDDHIRFDVGVAMVAATYSIGRDADGTNQLHFNVPTGAGYEFSINDVSKMQLLTGGALVVGHTAAVGTLGQLLEVHQTANYGGIMAVTWSATAGEAPILEMSRSKSATKGTHAALALNDVVGIVRMRGSDGVSAFQDCAIFEVVAQDTFTATNSPAKINIHTTGYGLASSTVRLTIGTVVPVSAVGSILHMPAQTLAASIASGTVAIGAGVALSVVTWTNSAATLTFTNAATLYIAGIPVASTNVVITNTALALWVDNGTSRFDGTVQIGVAGSVTGVATLSGATSGTVSLTVAAAAGTWTMTLPTGVAGTGGDQLTDAAGNGVTSWAAVASLREYKDVLGHGDRLDALNKILNVPVFRYHYREDARSSTRDFDTEYMGVMAEDAPWAMHYKGRILNPANTFGYTALAIQALYERIQVLESQIN